MSNKLIIAAAGSGKTTYLVDKASRIVDENVLITTYTESNKEEIKRKFCGYIPNNITIQTWFSFLLQHGVRPYQSKMDSDLHEKRIGFYLSEGKSGIYKGRNGNTYSYGEDKDFYRHYFTKGLKIFSDKISKFISKCDDKTNGEIIDRISRIYPHIYNDEIQDLAGWDLELLKLLFNSQSNILLVGDPRQVTYLTHHSSKYKKYKKGKIKNFIEDECNNKRNVCDVVIDESSLNKSHRNNKFICKFSSGIYPEFEPCSPCNCEQCRNSNQIHQGVFLVRTEDIEEYFKKFNPQRLRERMAKLPELNYGNSKGLTFDRCFIYPTKKIKKYLINGNISQIDTIRAKFYVALTRAKYSVGIQYDYKKGENYISGLKKYVDDS